ncbi:A24 family peptidase [Pendulispora brunnea]|uniref:A24 family peptidase n=1 Tax=Pendulispora brunnea TaxID=2905690 RepID=A0ABZ2KD46_9BACT
MFPFLIAAIILAAVAAWTDWRTGFIPNWLTFGVLGLAPIVHIVRAFSMGIEKDAALLEGGYSVLGAVVCGLVPWILFQKNAIGGGDVKVFAAIGALCQTMLGFEAEMYGFLAACLIAPARLAYDGKLLRTLKNAVGLMINPFMPKDKKVQIEQEMLSWMRMGPAILLGTIIAAALHFRE